MRKLILLILTALCFASAFGEQLEGYKKYEVKILSKLVLDVTKKPKPKVYYIGLDGEDIKILKKSKDLSIVNDIKKADFVFVKNLSKDLKVKKPVFSLDFKSLKYCSSCFGVFSWRNGRPMLIIFEEAIKSMGIKLPEEYDYFIDSKKYLVSG
ncbi:hypothetical protein [Persephonella sp.]